MFNIRIYNIFFPVMLEETERKKMDKIKIFAFGFSTLLKVSGTYRVVLALE